MKVLACCLVFIRRAETASSLIYIEIKSLWRPLAWDVNNDIIMSEQYTKKTTMGNFVKGNLCILTATIFFGVNIPVAKILIPHWMTSMDLTVFRLMGGCLLMWIASIFLKTTKLQREDWRYVILGGALGIFLFIFLFNMSLHYGNPIDVAIIMTLPPVFVILIGVIFRHNRTSWLEISGVGVAFAGAFLVIATGHDGDVHGGGSNRLLGDLLALASALCYAFYLVIIEKPSKTYRPVSLLRWVFLFASVPALALLPAFPHAEIFHHIHDYEPWALIAFVMLCPTFLAYFLLSPATKLIGSELVSIYQYLVPVVATITAVVIGMTTLHWVQVVSMVVIIVGMILVNIAKKRMGAAHTRAQI